MTCDATASKDTSLGVTESLRDAVINVLICSVLVKLLDLLRLLLAVTLTQTALFRSPAGLLYNILYNE